MPKALLPAWRDDLEEEEWGEEGEPFSVATLPALPGLAGAEEGTVVWKRPSEYVPLKPPPPPKEEEDEPGEPSQGIEVVLPLAPPAPKPWEVDAAAAAAAAAEAEAGKGKKGKKKPAKKPAKGKGKKGKGAAEDVPPMILPKELLRPVLAGAAPGGAAASGAQSTFAACLRAIGGLGASARKGAFLWESIYPKGPDTRPCYNPAGRYIVRMFWAGEWRRVEVDDRLPFDSDNRRLFVCSGAVEELWPALLYKAWLTLTQGTPGAVDEPSLMFYALSGFLPQAVTAPINDDAWPLLASLLPYNEPTRGDFVAATARADELKNARYQRRKARDEERRRRAEAGESEDSDDESDEDDDDDLMALEPELQDVLEHTFKEVPRAVSLAVTCTAEGEVPVGGPAGEPNLLKLRGGDVYSIVAIRDNATDGVRRVQLAGAATVSATAEAALAGPVVQPALPSEEGKDADGNDAADADAADGEGGKEADAGDSKEGEGKADDDAQAEAEAEPQRSPTAFELWVPVDDLAKYVKWRGL